MWNRFKWKLQSFMIGRNGLDELSRTLIYIAIGLDIIALIMVRWLPIPGTVITYISYVLCFIFIYRTLSKNIAQRKKENDKYNHFVRLWKLRISQRKDYKIYVCKGCGRNIRIPRGKGKIEVRCPVCGNVTVHRT